LLVACGAIAAQPSLHFEALLTDAMLAESHGECPADLMAPNVKAACDEQMPRLKGVFERLGPLQKTTFERTLSKEGNAVPVEIYNVEFQHGTWEWQVRTDETGKLHILWAPQARLSSTSPLTA